MKEIGDANLKSTHPIEEDENDQGWVANDDDDENDGDNQGYGGYLTIKPYISMEICWPQELFISHALSKIPRSFYSSRCLPCPAFPIESSSGLMVERGI